jgi:hypothetical protein
MAQRLANIAPIGSLLKGSNPKPKRKADMGRAPRQRDEAHLAAIRLLPCLVPSCGLEPCEAAHVRMSRPGKPNAGVGAKPDDCHVVPLCRDHHREQHAGSEEAFWAAHDIDPLNIAAALYRLSPDQEAMRAVVKTVHAIDALEESK